MKISSQLANNFDYCSTEIEVLLDQELFTLRPQHLRGEFNSMTFFFQRAASGKQILWTSESSNPSFLPDKRIRGESRAGR
jgi:hypothetical protein